MTTAVPHRTVRFALNRRLQALLTRKYCVIALREHQERPSVGYFARRGRVSEC
jgi:hypothetical protein